MRRRLTALIAVLAAFTGQPAAAVELATYSARYDLVLEALDFPGAARSWNGSAAIRITRDCQKWKILFELAYEVELPTGVALGIHTMGRFYEGLDGKRLEFTGWIKTNGGSKRNIKGSAVVHEDGSGGMVLFKEPEALELDLPPGTILPMAAMAQFIDALANNQPLSGQRDISGLGVTSVTRVVAGNPPTANNQPTGNPELLHGRSWRIETSLYADGRKRGKPLVTSAAQVHANGIVSQFWCNFAFMSINGELVSLEEIPTPDC